MSAMEASSSLVEAGPPWRAALCNYGACGVRGVRCKVSRRRSVEEEGKKIVVIAPSFLGPWVFLVFWRPSPSFRGLLTHGPPPSRPGPGPPGALSGKPYGEKWVQPARTDCASALVGFSCMPNATQTRRRLKYGRGTGDVAMRSHVEVGRVDDFSSLPS